MTSTKRYKRSFEYALLFERHFEAMKGEFGHGRFSWTEGMTRRAARRIARNRARKEFRADRKAA